MREAVTTERSGTAASEPDAAPPDEVTSPEVVSFDGKGSTDRRESADVRRAANAGPIAEDEVTEWLGTSARPSAAAGFSSAPGSPAAVTSPAAGPPEAVSQPGRRGARRSSQVAVIVLIAVLAAALLGVAMVRQFARSPDRPSAAPRQNQAAAWDQAANWVARQVSPDAGVSCDPVMCAALRAHGFPSRDLLVLGPKSRVPIDFTVVVETPAVLSLYGSSLATAWAPAVLASFGSGPAAIVVRVIAPHGAAAYQTALSTDLANRRAAGATLLHDRRVTVSTPANPQLTAGAVDSRLLLALAALARHRPISIVRFGNAGPGAGPGVPFRSVDLAENVAAAHLAPAAYARAVRSYLGAVSVRFRPASMTTVVLADGQAVLRVEVTAPSPLGVFGPHSAPGGALQES